MAETGSGPWQPAKGVHKAGLSWLGKSPSCSCGDPIPCCRRTSPKTHTLFRAPDLAYTWPCPALADSVFVHNAYMCGTPYVRLMYMYCMHWSRSLHALEVTTGTSCTAFGLPVSYSCNTLRTTTLSTLRNPACLLRCPCEQNRRMCELFRFSCVCQ